MTTATTNRLAERKLRDKEARRAQILRAARQIAEAEGWPSVTVRRLSDEIAYSQPVLYAHFGSREGIVTAVAIEGFAELGRALESARKQGRRGGDIRAVAEAYLAFAATSPALYEAMFSLRVGVPFGKTTPQAELRFAFLQIAELFGGKGVRADVLAELFWASLHGVAELLRTGRFPPSRQRERVSTLVALFTVPVEEGVGASTR